MILTAFSALHMSTLLPTLPAHWRGEGARKRSTPNAFPHAAAAPPPEQQPYHDPRAAASEQPCRVRAAIGERSVQVVRVLHVPNYLLLPTALLLVNRQTRDVHSAGHGNCRHVLYPYIPTYTHSPLAALEPLVRFSCFVLYIAIVVIACGRSICLGQSFNCAFCCTETTGRGQNAIARAGAMRDISWPGSWKLHIWGPVSQMPRFLSVMAGEQCGIQEMAGPITSQRWAPRQTDRHLAYITSLFQPGLWLPQPAATAAFPIQRRHLQSAQENSSM